MNRILIKTVMVVMSLISAPALADDSQCSLHSEGSFYSPHNIVEKDFNGDGIKDLFYLAGKDNVFLTCVFLGTKTPTKIEYELVHSHSDFYDTFFDFDNTNTVQILVPSELDKDCGPAEGDDAVYLVPEAVKEEIRNSYEKWSKGFEALNFTYNMPDFFPIQNLYLLNEVKIYKLVGKSKIDVTEEMTSYLDLKRKILFATIRQKFISKKCKARLEKTLSGLHFSRRYQ